MDKATATEIHSRSPDAQHYHPNAFYFRKCARHASSVRSAFPRFALSAHIGITGIHTLQKPEGRSQTYQTNEVSAGKLQFAA